MTQLWRSNTGVEPTCLPNAWEAPVGEEYLMGLPIPRIGLRLRRCVNLSLGLRLEPFPVDIEEECNEQNG